MQIVENPVQLILRIAAFSYRRIGNQKIPVPSGIQILVGIVFDASVTDGIVKGHTDDGFQTGQCSGAQIIALQIVKDQVINVLHSESGDLLLFPRRSCDKAVKQLLPAVKAVELAVIRIAVLLHIPEHILLRLLKHLSKGETGREHIFVILVDLVLQLFNCLCLYGARDGFPFCIVQMQVITTVAFAWTVWEGEIITA